MKGNLILVIMGSTVFLYSKPVIVACVCVTCVTICHCHSQVPVVGCDIVTQASDTVTICHCCTSKGEWQVVTVSLACVTAMQLHCYSCHVICLVYAVYACHCPSHCCTNCSQLCCLMCLVLLGSHRLLLQTPSHNTSWLLVSDVNKDWTHKDKDQAFKDNDKDFTYKDKDKTRTGPTRTRIKPSRTRTRTSPTRTRIKPSRTTTRTSPTRTRTKQGLDSQGQGQ